MYNSVATMFKRITFATMFTIRTLLLIAILSASTAYAQGIDIQYGVVSDIDKSQSSGSSNTGTGAAAGGLLGGLLGATSSKANSSGEKRRRSLFYGAGGALVGGLIGSSTGGNTATIYKYSVDLLEGGGRVNITTEQGHIDRGDCVSVERGNTNNIRKVAQVICDVPAPGVEPEHRKEAQECNDAKQELLAAEGGEAIDTAIRKVKILCDD